MTEKIAFRVDGSVAMGAGHLVRCLTLAQRLTEMNCEVLFICRHVTDTIRTQIASLGFALTMLPPATTAGDGDLTHSGWLGTTQEADAEATIAALAEKPFAWLVVDHYALDARWEKLLAGHAESLLVIDDLADRLHHCDVLLDQNLQDYNRYAELIPKNVRLLIGPRYAMLRPEFRSARAGHRPSSPRRLNVFFGSTDPKGMTLIALESLRQIENLIVDVIIGRDNPHRDDIADTCRNQHNVTLHVQPNNVADLLARADLTLGAGGTTSWERCCLGLPTLIVSVADNQRAGTEALAQAGAVLDLGRMEDVSPTKIHDAVQSALMQPDRLAAMRSAARAIVDGRGAERVAVHMMRKNIALRLAEMRDAEAILEWRNDSRTRRFFNDPSAIRLPDHLAWWRKTLNDPLQVLLVAQCGGGDIGVLRFDIHNDAASVSIYLDPDMIGLGLGRGMLRAGAAWLGAHHPQVKKVLAEIDPDNTPSIGSFVSAGFSKYTERMWALELI